MWVAGALLLPVHCGYGGNRSSGELHHHFREPFLRENRHFVPRCNIRLVVNVGWPIPFSTTMNVACTLERWVVRIVDAVDVGAPCRMLFGVCLTLPQIHVVRRGVVGCFPCEPRWARSLIDVQVTRYNGKQYARYIAR